MDGWLERLLDLPKTLYFNFYYFPFRDAVKLPLYVSRKVKIGHMGSRNSLSLSQIRRGIVKIGVSKGSFALGSSQSGWWNIHPTAKIVFKGKANMASGCNIELSKKACLEVGDNFYCNVNTIISVNKRIRFGSDVLTGWNCVFIDGDGHQVVDEDSKLVNPSQDIVVGNHVWFASYASVLKGSTLPDNCIVAFKANVSGSFCEENTIIGGNPAKIIKKNINWKHDRI